MLPKPYKFVMNIGFNDYYYFKLEDFAYGYLATNTVEELSEITVRRFRKNKVKNHEIPIGLKLLPLNSLILFIIYQANGLKEYTYELDVDNNKLPVYAEWDDFDINDLKKVFNEAVVKPVGAHQYELNHVIHNAVARSFDKEGYSYFATENVNSLNRSYWLIKTTKFGHLDIVEVKETGVKGKSVTTSVTETLLDRKLLERISHDLDEGNFSDEEDIEYTEFEDLDELRKGEL